MQDILNQAPEIQSAEHLLKDTTSPKEKSA